MITIGNNVKLTRGVSILTHGFDWCVLKGKYGDVLGSAGQVTVGNNVFIGTQSTLLKGITIGNNVIIGANSLVNKNIPDNCVAAGNPCRVIMNLEEYYEKRKSEQVREAQELVKCYRDPNENNLHEFFLLYTDSVDDLKKCNINLLSIQGNKEESIEKLQSNKKKFLNFKNFLESVF